MARPTTITDQQILDAAREAFLEHGYQASTLDIARQAGISEASIFKRFGSKEKLFYEALQIPEVPPWIAELDGLVGAGDVQENLICISLRIVAFLEEMVPRIMLQWGSRPGRPDPFRGLPEPPPVRDRRALAHFLQREIDRGRLRSFDPDLVARLLLGGLFSLAFEKTTSSPPSREQATECLVRGMVGLIWAGVSPKTDEQNP
jgi:AcrR family transcriptional regulator